MAATSRERDMERLMADPRLVELCELHRTGDSIFDVVRLSEKQNSTILAWMLDPKEGHSQGDEVLRDLLTHASSVFSSGGSGLDKRGVTAHFLARWPASRIRTSSFASAFTLTEFWVSETARIDLCVVDTQNNFVVIIENKVGARHTEEQLERYREDVGAALKANPRLRKLDSVYIAMDYYHDATQEAPRPSGSYWLHVGYDWLETSAVRAQAHVSRGNASAKLVAAYCQRLADLPAEGAERVEQLAAAIHQAHPGAINELLGTGRQDAANDWLTSPAANRTKLLFSLQNKSVIKTLRETKGMASVLTEVRAAIPGMPRDNLHARRATLDVCPRGCENLSREEYWPVYIRVRYSGKDQTKFNVLVCWDQLEAKTPEVAHALRGALAVDDERFDSYTQARRRRVPVWRGLTLDELKKVLVELEARLSSALA
ncbi:hypothetical protein ABIE56_000263 [Luteibacter sp. 621]|uniref:PDDEXK-like family protein n=1 Tax=Luteibacter sp. 621 TaxID=3373916 RepID=UPI003D1B560C